jgi:CubicO group peptidase (beta-lactamase class C family)
VIQRGLQARAFPAAVVNVGRTDGVRWQEAFGRLTYAEAAPACELGTLFDLASLTKVIATASVAMAHLQQGRLSLDTRVGAVFPAWDRGDRAHVSVRHLLDHSSGLPAHLRLWTVARGRDAYRQAILETPLERRPGEASVYSDPGFILLGFLLEHLGGAALDQQVAAVLGRSREPLLYRPPASLYERTAPTEFDPWRGRILCGEVHDENAAAIGGVAGHAGLFGTAEAVGAFARLVLATFAGATRLGTPDVIRTFAAKTGVPGSSRALAWDTALPTSSCGTKMSPTAIGHTGFTGTSLWIDVEKDFYAVLLTNRVHPTRANEQLPALRPQFHDALAF